MKVAVGSDMRNHVTDALIAAVKKRGHDVILFGALNSPDRDSWPDMAREVASEVAANRSDTGIVCCWTGTGASIAANKVKGARAALCGDAQTAAGAREWNDANVLALSLRSTSEPVMEEMLDAWFSAKPTTDEKYAKMIEAVE